MMGHGMAAQFAERRPWGARHRPPQPGARRGSRGAAAPAKPPDLGAIAHDSDVHCALRFHLENCRGDNCRPEAASCASGRSSSMPAPRSRNRPAASPANWRRLGIGYADAPLTGGPEQAASAELGVLCGAALKHFRRILAAAHLLCHHHPPFGARRVRAMRPSSFPTFLSPA